MTKEEKMIDLRRQKLIDLGSETLADALLDFAFHSRDANDVVERLIVTPKENIQRFKKKLSDLKDSTRYIDWRGVYDFSTELIMILRDLEAGVEDPLTGVKLVVRFYEADETIFEMCDDSSANIAYVFEHYAKKLFLKYAKLCNEKEKISDIILKAAEEDNYGVRYTLIDCAAECLPKDVIYNMISKLQKLEDKEKDKYKAGCFFRYIKSLYCQIEDIKPF